MRKMAIAAMAFFFAAITGCAQPPTDQRELARVQWLSGIKEIIKSDDLADYHNVATQLNLQLSARHPFQVKDVDGNVTGNSFDVETVPVADKREKNDIEFYYGIYTPNDQSYQRAMLSVRNVTLGECVTESDIYSAFGYVRGKTYPHSTTYSIDYHFEGRNSIDLYLTFNSINDKCAREITVFQNRWK
ncbi:hypothetical protein PQQ63_23935 [Paraburkholderia metrosideri]|uniref:Lipoprotein n=1 Tax=Paraburkholderia metrosideri TaxID=580937 RepID=A0ABW9DYL5_9BURK